MAAALAASATVPATGAEHPDADLLALGREWETSARREAAANRVLIAADENYVRPPWPQAIFWREDELHFYHLTWPEYGADGMPTGRYRYDVEKGREHFRSIAVAVRQRKGNTFSEEWDRRELDRAQEVIAACDAWEAEDAAHHEAIGCRAASDALEDEIVRNRALIWEIVKRPARTLDGVLLKARALVWAQVDSVADLEEDWQRAVTDGRPGEETYGTALLLDLLRVGGVAEVIGSAVRA